MKDEEPFLLDDPGRLKALAHPMRRLMLRHLNRYGPATSTTLGELLGAKTGTTSYHLRQLEKYGFIEEIPERSTGRERWWRRAAGRGDLRLPTPDQISEGDRQALAEIHRTGMEEDRELFERFPEAYLREPRWVKGSRGFGWMTEEEFDAFFEAYVALLRRHAHRAEDAPPGARPMHVRLFALPADSADQKKNTSP
ncbi:ArsR/SmtB family transcription factor [Sphaerisporangium fuscum]|uniref:ArsR/SmtB family transcription factor n=1 Tax=Sphaerisporangium fuscum TaxID=2835868 RepID=UPI001BDD9BCE|nr:helix-turn-helix domain-containing protein [Sphaerisporangium fuscum]